MKHLESYPQKVLDSLFQPEMMKGWRILSSTTLLVVYLRMENLQAIE